MKIVSKPLGSYQTNCYIVSKNQKEIIIDPGVGATEWLSKNLKNPIAILNTHGHFDHVWSNQELKERYNIPIYISKFDAFMLQSDPFHQRTPKSKADYLVEANQTIFIGEFEITFHHFPGHTPGSSLIEIDKSIAFSGDFIFKGSIGRVDFPYSNPNDMKKSINRFIKEFNRDIDILTGHGDKTDTEEAKKMLRYFLKYL